MAISSIETGFNLPAVLPENALHFGNVAPMAVAYILSQYAHKTGGQITYIASEEAALQPLMHALHFFAPDIPTLKFPAFDTLPYDRLSPSSNVTAQRMHCLHQLLTHAGDTKIILTSIQAITQKLPPKSLFDVGVSRLIPGMSIARDALVKKLISCGYQRISKVIEPGEFALRGSIIDIFPAGKSHAVRLDFFGDELESIKKMDVGTQRSDTDMQALEIIPIREILLNDETIRYFREQYRALNGNSYAHDPLYTHISAGQNYAGMEHWLALFYPKLESFFDYTSHASYFVDHLAMQTLGAHREEIEDYYQARRAPAITPANQTAYHPVAPDRLFFAEASIQQPLNKHPTIYLSPYKNEVSNSHINLPFQAAPMLKAQNKIASEHILSGFELFHKNASAPIIIACHSEGSKQRLKTMLAQLHITSQNITQISEGKTLGLKLVGLCVMPVQTGFSSAEFTLLSEQDILGERSIRTTKKRKKSALFLQEAASFEMDELVVHQEHGIGRFEGLLTLEVGTAKHDCVKLTYQGGDRLFIPVENIDLITRYGNDSGHTELDKLGGVSWQKRKSSLKKKLKMAASALLKIAAKRLLAKAPLINAPSDDYSRFCNQFPYTETEDQLTAIEDVMQDLQSGTIMDRLICGDVGFGKTEIAMRAAFAMCAQGYQVAMVVPTTLLARQHFQSFCERFNGFSPKIAQISRMVSAKESARIKQGLKDGSVDIVIGTHALLSAQIDFKNLGMLIIDEEQHFGVKQKEKLKNLKADIHVLTLSATPIPRTLQLSLSGIRALSLITTPPIDRLAIRSVIMPFDAVIVKDALLREKHRGGQSFYVTPRVQYIAEIEKMLKEILPEHTVGIAHGQMSPIQLDKTMQTFCDGKYDLLLSTAIIESGIDIPTANTMIIDHPELFGLSQLYQLRGRIGRGKARAHAYFVLPPARMLTKNATRRLDVMQKLDHLGAGFSIASHDMDIRGFGNVLGEEQSGHIKEVGIELYQAMLEEAIAEMKEKRLDNASPKRDFSPQITIGIPVLIPENYVEDLSLRLSLYRRAANLQSNDEIDDFIVELTDRFGTPPQETIHLLEVMRLKLYCKQAGIIKLDAGDKAMVVEFHENAIKNPNAFIALIASAPKRYKLRANQTVLIRQASKADASRLVQAILVAQAFAKLNQA
jgi:transcription-repair coupling factor (superfamily II helicase)